MKQQDRQRGFTLIELLLVLMLVGIIISIAILSTKYTRESAMLAVFQMDIRRIKTAAARYEVDCGFFPPDVWRGIDPGLAERDGWQKGNHSPVWETLNCDTWGGPYLPEWPHNPWGGLYDWDNYPSSYTAWGIPGGGVYLTLKPSTWGGKDGLPTEAFEELCEYRGVDVSPTKGVIAVFLGREPTWSVPGQPH